MKRLFIIVLILVIGVFEAKGQKMNRCGIDEFDSLIASLDGQDSLDKTVVPEFFKKQFRKAIMKAAYDKDEKAKKTASTMSGGLEEIVMIKYDKCRYSLRDSINSVLAGMIQPNSRNYCADSCYVYGFSDKRQDVIDILLMHIASQSTIIYIKGKFPITE